MRRFHWQGMQSKKNSQLCILVADEKLKENGRPTQWLALPVHHGWSPPDSSAGSSAGWSPPGPRSSSPRCRSSCRRSAPRLPRRCRRARRGRRSPSACAVILPLLWVLLAASGLLPALAVACAVAALFALLAGLSRALAGREKGLHANHRLRLKAIRLQIIDVVIPW